MRALGAEVRSFPFSRVGEVASAHPDRIAVAGGDGSIGPGAAAAGRAGVPLAVVPTGTANDFARALELPLELEAACRLAVEGRHTRALDLAWMEGRPFVNAASAGLSPVAALRARGWKRALGPLAYALGALQAGLTARPVECRVSCDGDELFAGRAWQVTVSNTGAFGAGAEVEAADPTDGLLDATAIEARSRARLALHAAALRAGRVTRQPGVRSGRGKTVGLELPPGSGLNLDGELLTCGPTAFRVERKAFELVVA
jgi:diacylglycerol kinase (ATP)